MHDDPPSVFDLLSSVAWKWPPSRRPTVSRHSAAEQVALPAPCSGSSRRDQYSNNIYTHKPAHAGRCSRSPRSSFASLGVPGLGGAAEQQGCLSERSKPVYCHARLLTAPPSCMLQEKQDQKQHQPLPLPETASSSPRGIRLGAQLQSAIHETPLPPLLPPALPPAAAGRDQLEKP